MKTLLAALALTSSLTHASVTVVVNGSNHTIPQTNEKGWGTNVTAWIQAISSYTLQPSGGTFTLTADTYFGATYGLKSQYYKTASANPSTAGTLRLANSDTIGWRNNANGGNVLLSVDSSDRLLFDGVLFPTLTASNFVDSGFNIVDNGDTTKKIAFQASGITTGTTRTITVPDANVNLGALVNANIDAAAAIAYTKLNLGTSILNADVNASAAIALSKLAATTASRALVSDGSGFVSPATTTATEIGYVNGVTSAIQTQLDAKTLKATLTTKGDIYAASASATPTRVGVTGNDGYVLTEDAASTGGVKFAVAATAPISSKEISNCSIATSVASSALTIALKDGAGSDPSGGSPCKIGFRNVTPTTGTFAQVSATAATSVVVSNGSALGCTATAVCYLKVYAVNNAGAIVLGVINGSLDEGSVQSGVAEGGIGGADALQTLYTSATQTTKAVRLLGRITITPAAAHAWTANSAEISNVPFAEGLKTTLAGTVGFESADLSCSSGSSITSQQGSWLTSIGNVSGGACVVTIKTGIFASTPLCFASYNGVGASPLIVAAAASSATSVTVDSATDAGAAGSNYPVQIFCVGPR